MARQSTDFDSCCGVKPSHVYSDSDAYGFNIAEGGVHVHDLQAAILHRLGIDHEELTYLFQGRQFHLTIVHGEVVKDAGQNEYRRLNCNCRSLVFEVTAPKVALRGSTVAVFQLGWLVQL